MSQGRLQFNFLLCLSLMALSLSVSACESNGGDDQPFLKPSEDAPKWVKTSNADDLFNPAVYLWGIGSVQATGDRTYDKRMAFDQARRDILQKLVVRVESEFQRRVNDFVGSENVSETTAVTTDRIRTTTEGFMPVELDGGQDYYDEGLNTLYMLAAVNRGELADALRIELNSQVSGQKGLIDTMRKLVSEKRALESLRTYPRLIRVTQTIALITAQRGALLNRQDSERYGAVSPGELTAARAEAVAQSRCKVTVTGMDSQSAAASASVKSVLSDAGMESTDVNPDYIIEVTLYPRHDIEEYTGNSGANKVSVARTGWKLTVRNTFNNAEVYTKRATDADAELTKAVVPHRASSTPRADAESKSVDLAMTKMKAALAAFIQPATELEE